jgi:hypothetical protein
MSNLNRGPSIALVHLAMRLQRRRFFRNRPTKNKNCLWQPCLLMYHDEMSNLNRGPSIALVHLAMRLQRRRFFRNRPTRNKNCLWQQCLLTYHDEMSNLYRRPSIDASYQLQFIWQCSFREDF